MMTKSAAEVAVELYHEPRLAEKLAKVPLHRDVLSVIKVAAGDETALQAFPASIATRPELARQISKLYILKVLFHDPHNDHRLLGLNPGATARIMNDNKRWLQKWLHPDRNNNKWEQAFFNAVSEAARHFETDDPTTTLSATPKPHLSCKSKRTSKSRRHLHRRTKPERYLAIVAQGNARKARTFWYAAAAIVVLTFGLLGIDGINRTRYSKGSFDSINTFFTGK